MYCAEILWPNLDCCRGFSFYVWPFFDKYAVFSSKTFLAQIFSIEKVNTQYKVLEGFHQGFVRTQDRHTSFTIDEWSIVGGWFCWQRFWWGTVTGTIGHFYLGCIFEWGLQFWNMFSLCFITYKCKHCEEKFFPSFNTFLSPSLDNKDNQ